MGIALSGINASQKDLDTTSNNIANVGSIGFKSSRAEFADVYATSIFSNASTTTGNGVKTVDVAQQFHQGALNFTENSLDLAISGEGFFVTAEDTTTLQRNYTRAGAFKLNADNYVVNSAGEYLQGYGVNDEGESSAVSMASTKGIQINSEVGSPTQTTSVDMGMNFPSYADEQDVTMFNPDDSDTYTSSTSVSVYDSLGEAHTMQTYFVKSNAAENTWETFTYMDGLPVDVTGGTAFTGNANNEAFPGTALPLSTTIVFDSSGAVTSQTPGIVTTAALNNTNGSDPSQTITLNFDPTQYASAFEVSSLSQDGSTVGKLTGINIGDDGLVTASYSNGVSRNISRVAMAQFNNSQGLSQIGDTAWQASKLSGEAVAGEGNSGTFGSINSSALEQSNVNLTNQLVNLISAQRNFQANSRTLEVESGLQQTIIQIR
jgi:flagellar hook protein FlgE